LPIDGRADDASYARMDCGHEVTMICGDDGDDVMIVMMMTMMMLMVVVVLF
jgi:hypothetical protein